MEKSQHEILQKVSHTVRALSADAIEVPKSGHPGLPLGVAEIGSFLFTQVLRHNPKNPDWMGRDRFILSAGHGSMLLYSLLHLCGYDVTMEDIKKFRTLHSKTPGHPEVGETPGVETTTGPLGQGVANGTGMAIAQKFLAARFGEDLFNSKIWVLAGDGCLMEGISSEAGSLAGTLGLDNLVIIYDSNDVCLDGPLAECMVEDTAKRYESYGFSVLHLDGYDFDQMEEVFSTARYEEKKPTLIVAKTIIGKHCPNRQGKSVSHGKPLGSEEMQLFKEEIGWPQDTSFYVPEEVRKYCQELLPRWNAAEKEWNQLYTELIRKDDKKSELWDIFAGKKLPYNFDDIIWNLEIKPNQATRKYNEAIIQVLADTLPYFVTASADLACSDLTWVKNNGIIAKTDWNHQQLKFGVREFSMAAAATGMYLHGMIQPAVGTFLVFSDYMRSAMRMAALMKQRTIFIFTHDSIQLGEDGPTHQPVEHLMSLRLIPNLISFRPADENETKAAWIKAMKIEAHPVALCLTRSSVPSSIGDLTAIRAREGVAKGAYVVYGKPDDAVDVEIYSTGSELHLACEVAETMEKDDLKIRVISVPSWELFEAQDDKYKKSILSTNTRLKVSIEAGVGLGWQRFVGTDGLIISQDTFGASAPMSDVLGYFGFTADKIYTRIQQALADKT